MSDEKDLKTTEDAKAEVVEETPTEKVQEEKIENKEEAKAEVVEETPTEKIQEEKIENKEEAQEAQPAYVPKPETPHDEFDWTIGNKHTLNYTEAEQASYLKDYERSLSTIGENEIVRGKVTAFQGGDVVLDVNYKSDGLVSTSEFRDIPDMKIGDFVDVYVETKEDIRGQLVLSRRKAKLLNAWDMLRDSYNNGTIIKGHVISKTKGGLIVDCSGLETFLPGSQIDIKPIIDYDSYVNKTMEFKVVKINEAIKNAVVSHKALIESDLAEQRETIIAGLEKGQVLEGIVKNITDFGAFMDLGGVDGLLYITDISWGRINHPNEILELNQQLNVVVLDFDENKKRISLGLKQLQPHPWEILPADIIEGKLIKGKIVNIEDYGAFLEIIPGVEGLIHVSEVNWSNQPVNAKEYFNLGDEYDAKVVTIDREDRKMSLSIKQLSEDPWEKIGEKYPAETRHTGTVKNLTPYGVFVELETGIGGMIHISDLSWTKRYSHPSEFTKVASEIEIVVLEIDNDSRKLSLGHKQLEENPWDTFESVFPVGSYHEATLIRKDDRGGILQLPYGLEAFSPIKHIKKEDGSTPENDEKLTVKVIEFNRDDKRIIVSHMRYLDDIKREAEGEVIKSKDVQQKKVRKAVSGKQASVEKTTFGDMEIFDQLKAQFKDAPKPAPKAEVKAEKKKEAPAPEVKEEVADPVAKAKAEEKVEAKVEEKADAKADAKVEAKAEAPAKKAPAKKASAKKAPAKKAAPKASTKSADKPDDLKKIEGIGPKIAGILTDKGIVSFEDLSKAKVDTLKEILAEAGSRYKMHDPTTWPKQSKLAAADKWDELKELQDQLKGGR